MYQSAFYPCPAKKYQEWIKFRDEGDVISDESNVGKDGQASLGEGSRKDDPKTKFIPVPSDNALASQPCPICQEKFDVSRNEELQDFVWMDAIKIGNRVYHASCYADLKNDGANTPARTATPDSVLGKRKAEVSDGAVVKRLLLTCNRRLRIIHHRRRHSREVPSELLTVIQLRRFLFKPFG